MNFYQNLLKQRASLVSGLTLGLIATTNANAAPYLTHTVTEVGNGLYGIEVSVKDTDNNSGNYALTLEFSGNINQVKAFGTVSVNDQENAGIYDAIDKTVSLYDASLDSWFYDPFASNGIPGTISGEVVTGITGGDETGDNFSISASSGVAQGYDGQGLQLAYLVTDSDIAYEGILTRFGTSTEVSDVIAVPEPAALTALGALCLLASRRRKA